MVPFMLGASWGARARGLILLPIPLPCAGLLLESVGRFQPNSGERKVEI